MHDERLLCGENGVQFVSFVAGSPTVTGEGFSQCYNSTGCTGSLVGAVDQRDCCVGTNDGLSYNEVLSCTYCTGIDKLAA